MVEFKSQYEYVYIHNKAWDEMTYPLPDVNGDICQLGVVFQNMYLFAYGIITPAEI